MVPCLIQQANNFVSSLSMLKGAIEEFCVPVTKLEPLYPGFPGFLFIEGFLIFA